MQTLPAPGPDRAAPADRKAQILDTALALAFEAGPERVTTVAIAAWLGLSQPAIYRHFASKAGLWQAITARLGDAVRANIAEARALEAPPLARIRALLLGHLALIRQIPALPEIMLARDPGADRDRAALRDGMRARMAEFQQALAALCAAAQAAGELRRGAEPRDLAALILGVLQSLVLRLLLSRDVAVLERDGARLLELQLRALAREERAGRA